MTVVDDGTEQVHLGLKGRIAARLQGWREDSFLARLKAGDWRLWSDEPIDEIADRLGWLNLPNSMEPEVEGLEELASQARQAGIAEVLLLGMGGSSLAPEVFQATFESSPGVPRVTTVDTTHPGAIKHLSKSVDPNATWVIVSSKSGGTLETASLHQYFWDYFSENLSDPAEHFIAITDPGTELEAVAHRRDYRAVFAAPSDVGGRFSALSYFGLVPAALIGVDIRLLLDRARQVLESEAMGGTTGLAHALELGAILGEAAAAGRDKLTLYSSPGLASFPDWLEQLVAESSGKSGKGILPVVGEALAPPDSYGLDRCFLAFILREEENQTVSQELHSHLAALEASGHPVIRRTLKDRYDLGAEIMVWELAVAAACSVLGVPPFNQPDVQLAKEMAKSAMQDASDGSYELNNLSHLKIGDRQAVEAALQEMIERVDDGDYIAILAYLQPTEAVTLALSDFQAALRRCSGSCVTVGYGPRYLHSTGQLHKGGAPNGHFVQLVDRPDDDLKVPETTYTFDRLIEAQGLGDLRALRSREQDTFRLVLSDSPAKDLDGLTEAILANVQS